MYVYMFSLFIGMLAVLMGTNFDFDTELEKLEHLMVTRRLAHCRHLSRDLSSKAYEEVLNDMYDEKVPNFKDFINTFKVSQPAAEVLADDESDKDEDPLGHSPKRFRNRNAFVCTCITPNNICICVTEIDREQKSRIE